MKPAYRLQIPRDMEHLDELCHVAPLLGAQELQIWTRSGFGCYEWFVVSESSPVPLSHSKNVEFGSVAFALEDYFKNHF